MSAPSLTEFLLARIAEDEAVARETAWQSEHYSVFSYLRAEDGRHVERHDPARVLARCEADRRVVEAIAPLVSDGGMSSDAAVTALRALALPYADHPDYQEEWKP